MLVMSDSLRDEQDTHPCLFTEEKHFIDPHFHQLSDEVERPLNKKQSKSQNQLKESLIEVWRWFGHWNTRVSNCRIETISKKPLQIFFY